MSQQDEQQQPNLTALRKALHSLQETLNLTNDLVDEHPEPKEENLVSAIYCANQAAQYCILAGDHVTDPKVQTYLRRPIIQLGHPRTFNLQTGKETPT